MKKKIGSTRSIKTILAKGQAALRTNDGLILLSGDTGMDPYCFVVMVHMKLNSVTNKGPIYPGADFGAGLNMLTMAHYCFDWDNAWLSSPIRLARFPRNTYEFLLPPKFFCSFGLKNGIDLYSLLRNTLEKNIELVTTPEFRNLTGYVFTLKWFKGVKWLNKVKDLIQLKLIAKLFAF